MKEILEFLKDLDLNNTREWFNDNRSRYEMTRKMFLTVTEELIFKIREFDKEIPLLNPKDCVFRIFRDVRFSNDKRPYKTNFGCFIARGGRKAGFAGYYLHIQPGESFLSGGIYMPSPEFLKAIRDEIYYNPEPYISLMSNKSFKAKYTVDHFDKLKTGPKGYPKDYEYIELLKNRNYAMGCKLIDNDLLSLDFLDRSAKLFQLIYPLNHFLNRAIDENLSIKE